MESLHDKALQDEKMTSSELKWYTDLKAELGKYGIRIDDITKLAKFVDNLKQSDYNIEKIITESLNLELLRATHKHLQENIPFLENRKKDLERECSTLETMIAMHNQVLSKYHNLEVMGFGLNRLQFLWTTIREITRENNINPEEAVTKFLSDVESQYNNKLGFESKIESLRSEVNRLNQEQVILRAISLSLPLVGSKLVKLTQNGVTEQHIINIAALLEKYSGKDSESFVSELEGYGSLKSAIQELSKQAAKIRMEVDALQTQNRDLNADNQRISSSLVNSRHTFDFMQGLINSIRSEIQGSVSISAGITRSIGAQFEYLEKLKSNIGD
jgi:hypothetical protein